MRLELVYWDWSGTLFSRDIDSYPNYDLIKNNCVRCDLKKKTGLSTVAWFLVDCFLKKGIKQVIVSNGLKKNILKCLRNNPFDLILTAEEYEGKPSVEMLQCASEKLNIFDKIKMIVIGDERVDEMVAKKYGVKFFDINNSFECGLNILTQFDLL